MPTKRSGSERQRLIETVTTRLRRHGLARLQMTIIVIATGMVGFLVSAGLLAVGVSSMALRYGLAVVSAYAVFLCFVRLWVELHRRGIELDDAALESIPEPADPSLGGGGEFGGGGASGDWQDAPSPGNHLAAVDASSASGGGGGGGIGDLFDLDDALVIVIPIVIFIGALVASVLLIWSAPALLAEVLVDVVLVSGLYRRLAKLERRSWLVTAVRKTWIPATVATVVLVVCGLLLQLAVPGAESLGEVLRQPQR